ncbi:MAG: Do family serine endopeptidase [Gammaproteobacteria bacterium]|nr:Do family serine endopeptidase [Gammaproteobacteria bacterium]
MNLLHYCRKSLSFLFILLFCNVNFASVPVDPTLAPMLQAVMPAVVNIRAQIKITDISTLQEMQKQRGTKPADEKDGPVPTTYTSVGSGVIIDVNNGYILTNAHVISDAQTVTVNLSDGRHFTAKIIGIDKPSDVALIQIKSKNLTALNFADSNKLKVGDFVAAIGNPFGLGQTVTSGIVSALGRTTLGIENYENFIQTDAPINPGNSGGALINTQGQLVGINTANLTPNRGSVGIGFAIPANMVKSVMQQLMQHGNVKRGLLGIIAQDLTPELASAFKLESSKGAVIALVLPHSPASQAGLKIGDIIVAVEGLAVKNASDVINTVGFLRVDSKANFDLVRNGKRINTNIILTDPKKRKTDLDQMDPFLNGVGLKDFTLLSPIHGSIEGVLVVAVEQDSPAWEFDLRAGDVITSVNQQSIKNITDLKKLTATSNKTLLLNVIRGPVGIFLVMNKEV